MAATEPAPTRTLARLSFWVPPERMAAFEAVYEKQVVPILKRYGMAKAFESKRTCPIFKRSHPAVEQLGIDVQSNDDGPRTMDRGPSLFLIRCGLRICR